MRKLSLLSGILLASSLCFASPLTVEEALNAAKAYDDDYLLAQKQYADSVSITNKENSFTPSLSLNGSMSTNMGFLSSNGWNPTWQGVNASVGISTSFSFNGSLINEKKEKSLSNESSLLKLESSEDDLESTVVDGYFSIAQAKDSLALAQNSLENANAQLESIKARYDAGLASELELVQAENSVASSQYSLDSIQSQYSLLIKSFQNLTGLDLTERELIDASSIEIKELLSAKDLFTRYAYSSPSVKSLDLAARSANLSYSSTKMGYTIPSLSVSAGYTFNSSYNESTSIADGLSVSASISLPLDSYFSSSSKAIAIEKANNAAKDANVELSNALKDLEYSLESTCQSISLTVMQIENQEKIVSAFEKQYKLTEDAYYSGEVDLASLESANNSVLSAKYNLLNMKYTYIQSLYSLSRSLGVSYLDLLKEE